MSVEWNLFTTCDAIICRCLFHVEGPLTPTQRWIRCYLRIYNNTTRMVTETKFYVSLGINTLSAYDSMTCHTLKLFSPVIGMFSS